MNRISSVRQGRIRRSFIIRIVLLGFLMVACSADGESEEMVTAVPVTETATVEPTDIGIEPTEEITAEATEQATPEPTLPPTVEPTEEQTTVPFMGSLPVVDEISFEILGQYGGVPTAVAVKDGTAYVGFGPRLMTIDILDPANPRVMGESSLLADNIKDIAVVDGIAYLAAGRAGLALVDVSDAVNPVIVDGGPNYAGANRPSAEKVQIDSNLAYVTDFNRENSEVSLVTLDISNAADVKFVNGLTIQVNDNLVVDKGRMVIVGNGRIEVRDTAEPETIAGSAMLAGGDYSSQAVIRDNVVFVVETGVTAGVEVFDISDPTNPTAVGEIATVELYIGTQVAANETTLFSVGTFGEFGFCESQIDLIDISGDVPTSITRLSPGICLTDLFIDGSLLYVSGRNGLKIFDVTDPEAVQEADLITNPDGFHDAQAVAVKDGVTYILTGEGGGSELRMLNLRSDPAELYADVLPLGSTLVLDLFVTGDTLVAPQWQGGLVTFSLDDPTAPQLAFAPETDNSFSTGDIFSYATNKDIIYVPIVDGVSIGGIGVVDVSNAAEPGLITTIQTGDPQVMHLVSGNNYLYALAQGERPNIHIFDISDPQAPEAAGMVTMPEYSNRLALSGDTLYAVCDQWNCHSLYMINVSDPGSAKISGRWEINVGAADLVPAGEGLFLMTTYEEGIWVLNTADPAHPYLAGHIQLPGDYSRLKVVNGTIYAASFDGGLYLLEIK